MRNDFFFFSKGEKRGIIILATLLFLLVATTVVIDRQRKQQAGYRAALGQDSSFWKSYADFKSAIRTHTETAGQQKSRRRETPELQPFAFDPNTADSATLRRLGLPDWMARNIVRYREKGGRFRRAEDFQKIYGLTESQYRTLLPYISIAPQKDTLHEVKRLYIPPAAADSSRRRTVKYAEGTVIDLNRADTTELKKIPGIGSGIARMIAGYRKRLGGFYRIEQLAEIHLDYEQLRSWFSIQPDDIRRINLNTASVERLRHHPYFNFYQAKVIVEHRQRNGRLKSLKPLVLYEEFTPEDLERISHYVCFE